MAKASSGSWHVAVGVLVFGLFGFCDCSCLLAGRHLGSRHSTMPLAAGAAHGSNFQEAVIKIVAYSSAPTGIVSFALILWGLRIGNTQSRNG